MGRARACGWCRRGLAMKPEPLVSGFRRAAARPPRRARSGDEGSNPAWLCPWDVSTWDWLGAPACWRAPRHSKQQGATQRMTHGDSPVGKRWRPTGEMALNVLMVKGLPAGGGGGDRQATCAPWAAGRAKTCVAGAPRRESLRRGTRQLSCAACWRCALQEALCALAFTQQAAPALPSPAPSAAALQAMWRCVCLAGGHLRPRLHAAGSPCPPIPGADCCCSCCCPQREALHASPELPRAPAAFPPPSGAPLLPGDLCNAPAPV